VNGKKRSIWLEIIGPASNLVKADRYVQITIVDTRDPVAAYLFLAG